MLSGFNAMKGDVALDDDAPDCVATLNYYLELMQLHTLAETALGSSPLNPDPMPYNPDVEYEIEAVIASRKGKFLVAWKGYEPADWTWEPAAGLSGVELALANLCDSIGCLLPFER